MNKKSRDLELEQKIDAYIKGKLSDKEAQELWEKLLLRPDYIELLETELGIKTILENRDSTGQNSDNSTQESATIYSLKKSWKWIAAAACVAILIVAINFFQTDTQQSLSELAISNINVSQNISSAPVLRSQKERISPSDSLLNRGFEAAISGNITEALAMYDQIIEEYGNESTVAEAHLNKGIILYNSGQFHESISSFEHVVEKIEDRPITEEKAYWYMGNAYLNLQQLTKAREAIYKAYSIDGIYSRTAYRILRKLDQKLDNTDSEFIEDQNKENK